MKKKDLIDFNPFFLKIINLNKKLEFIILNYKNIKLANSLSIEDMLLTYFILSKNLNIEIFLLNTGQLFLGSINLLEKIKKKYKIFIKNYYSNITLIDKYIKKYTLNAFYNNIILRKICCQIRKIEPLNNALRNTDLWITGQRKINFISRENILDYEIDNTRNIVKCNLLLNWDFKDIFYFAEKFNILINFMHNLGYSSIGCNPCTKSVYFDESIRSGRWWWEINNKKRECGLHNTN